MQENIKDIIINFERREKALTDSYNNWDKCRSSGTIGSQAFIVAERVLDARLEAAERALYLSLCQLAGHEPKRYEPDA